MVEIGGEKIEVLILIIREEAGGWFMVDSLGEFAFDVKDVSFYDAFGAKSLPSLLDLHCCLLLLVEAMVLCGKGV
jgi:hypothetical protein